MTGPGQVVRIATTRVGPDGLELCVVDEPGGALRLPGGSVAAGEHASDAVRRILFERAGLASVEYRGTVAGTADDDLPVAHVVSTGDEPARWWVTSSSDGGKAWACRWLRLDDDELAAALAPEMIHVVGASARSRDHPPVVSRPEPDARPGTVALEMFWAPPWSGTRAVVTVRPPDPAVAEASATRAEVIALLPSGHLVATAAEEPLWSFPGGTREAAEPITVTAAREVLEETCCIVDASNLIGLLEVSHLDGARAGTSTIEAEFWARVSWRPFDPAFEMKHRAEMTRDEARRLPLWANPVTQELLERAFAADDRARAGG